MNIQTLDVQGFVPAMRAMRNPYESYGKADTARENNGKLHIGDNDMMLSKRLQNAGPEHCKHLRQIVVWADITADLTWWKQADTYRMGVEKVSSSTMHLLLSQPLQMKDFSMIKDGDNAYWPAELSVIIGWLNAKILSYKEETDQNKKKKLWQEVVNLLPESYLQTRTVMISYAAIRNIINQRKGHKLGEWAEFIEWAKTLPENWMLFE